MAVESILVSRGRAAMDVVQRLQQEGARLRVYDPQAMEKARELLRAVEFCDSPYTAATGADALVLCTEWDEFRNLDLAKLHAVMAQPMVLDGRNVFDPQKMTELGFLYKSVGR